MTQQALADALGMAQSQVSRYAKRGMPTTSVAAARAWIRSNIRLTMARYRGPASEPDVAEFEDVDPERALDAVALLGIAADALLKAGQAIEPVRPLLQAALRAVPHDHRDRVWLSGTDDELRQFVGCRVPRCEPPDDEAVFLPITVWSALVGHVVAAARAEDARLEAAGELLPPGERPAQTHDELAEISDLLYAHAAGEVVLP